MPLLNLVEGDNYNKAKELTTHFFDILLNSDYSLNIKITGLVQLYNSGKTDSGFKALAMERLILLCKKNGKVDIIIERARQILDISKDWNLTNEERRSLYKTVANTLDSQDDSSNAFKVMHAYIKMFTEDEVS